MMYFNTLSSEENIYEYSYQKKKVLCWNGVYRAWKWKTFWEREGEDPVREKKEEEEERSEKHGKVFQTEDGHDTTRFGEAV